MLHKNNPQSFFLEAKKSLGQNFLKDESVVAKIVENIDALFLDKPKKIVDEIGPGSGALTKSMLQKGIHVTGLEKDERAIEGLKKTLGADFPTQFIVVQADILKHTPTHNTELHRPVCVGNIPYYITSDILLWFTNHKRFYTHGIFMVQNEVADRLQAKSGTKDYSRLSVKIQLNFHVKKLFVVPSAAFVPKPKVDSAIVILIPKDDFLLPAAEEKSFETFCAVLFSARRKMLRRVLFSDLQNKEESKLKLFWDTLAAVRVYEDTRPDAIAPEAILALFYAVNQYLRAV